MLKAIPPFFTDRLRAGTMPATVPGSLPVLFFGDLLAASIATIGINPSRQEYLTRSGLELEGLGRRFETLGSLAARDRSSLSVKQMQIAIERMRAYRSW